ncbi:MAG TPA: TatD family hydrolase [Candidatus Baltobacteraceae bacterium]|jgi:TatD DNase family protein|nr:TatD family hydrolase [Candidatus Baltobacteraceae bacterium]
MMIDTHAHIHDPSFDADRDEIIARAHAAGVARIITVGCDLADSRRAIDAARRYDLDVAIGIHPHEAKDAPDDPASALAALLNDGLRPVAIGEIGLDYHYDHSPRERQRMIFRAQLRFAREHGFPMIFHQREAFDDFCEIVRTELPPGARGVVHCFTGDAPQALTLVKDFGFALGIGGVATFRSASGLREAIMKVGLDHLLLETDCPYLAPMPHRGKRNEPAFLIETARTLATLFGIELDEVITKTSENARRLFG